MHLVHLASRIIGTPLLIARPKLDVIISVLGSRIGLQNIGLPSPDMAKPIPVSRRSAAIGQADIAVIPVVGTLVRRSIGVEAASGLMSYGEIESLLNAALADPQVAGILLDLDSHGGEAGGVFDLAAHIRAAGAIKPIWAHVNDAAYSAAYAIAAAASRLTLSQTAGVGSIGVLALHVDQSVKDASDGYRYTAIIAGERKNDFSPHGPLTPQAAAVLQAEVDRLYNIFVNHVGQMRGLDPDFVRATEAGLFYGEQAVEAGLADAVMPLEQVMDEFSNYLSSRGRKTPPARSLARTGAIHLQEVNMSHKETQIESVGERADAFVSDDRLEDARSALVIAELCMIAGVPQRTAEFLAAGMTESQVRRALLEARAEQPEIASHITADAGTVQRPENSPVVAAVKKLTTTTKE